MSQSVTLRQNQPLAQSEWAVLREQAGFLVKSGFLPSSIRTPEQCVAIMLLGRELHIEPWAALSTINVIQGKPTVSPQLMLALIERSEQAEQITIDGDEQRATVTMKRKGRAAHTETFTMDDAKRISTKEDGKMIPLAEKYNWRSMPKVMLRWRAVAACARVTFPDVILGLYTPEEMGADVTFTDTGEIVVAPDTVVGPGPTTPPAGGPLPPWEVNPDTEELPFDPDPTPVDPATLAHYNTLIRHAMRQNATAARTNQPEKFDLAEWEILPGMSAEEVGSLGKRLKARLQEPTTAAV